LLNSQKNIVELYPKPSYAELIEVFEKYRNPPAEGEVVEGEPEAAVDGETVVKTPKKLAEGVEDVALAFDKLFKKGAKKPEAEA
jgi:hypothetical protein